MPWYTVQQGEWLQQIAYDNGFADESKIYNHPDNADLKKKRGAPELLKAGDLIFIPEVEPKKFNRPTDNVHRFVIKQPTTKLQIRIKEDGISLDSLPFKLTIAGHVHEGTSTADGLIEVEVPVAQGDVGQLEIAGHVLPVRLSHLDPLEELSGVKARLHNLGYDCGEIDDESSDDLADALRQFQRHSSLEETGELDDATRAALKDSYGC
jgi:Putative peptidoglycan binding domain